MTTTTSNDVWSTPLTPLAFLGRAAEVFGRPWSTASGG